MLRRIATLKSHHQIMFAIIIGIAIVSFWRGVWGLLDLYLMPNYPPFSLLASVIIGILILMATDYLTKEVL